MPASTAACHARPAPRLLALVCCFAFGLAQAGTVPIVVDSAEDSGPGSLRAAILQANANAATPGQRISIEVPGSGVVLNLASALPEIEALDLEIGAPASPGFTIDGGDTHAIIRAGTGSQRLLLADLHLRRGRAADGGCVRGSARSDAELQVLRMRFSDCRAVGSGGAGGRGGAVFVAAGSLDLRESRFDNNRAEGSGSRGGGLFGSAPSLGVFEARFVGNNAADGAGIAVVGATVDLVFLTDVRLQSNAAAGSGRGGGLLVECAFCVTTLSRGYLGQNSAGSGGAIAARCLGASGVGPTLALSNLTVERNQAQVRGGGLELAQTEAELRHLTLQNNSAPQGAHLAIVDSGNALGRVSNNVFGAVATGSGSACSLVSGGPTPSQRTGNLFADASCGNLASAGSASLPAGQVGSLDGTEPLIPVLVFPTGSPVIDGGSELACLQEDARGAERPQDGNGDGSALCDVGAYEHLPSPVIFRSGFEAGG
ncbi:MAG: hypothetical protein MEQ07_06115 [Aquimonas sp.]|nr:hypothetical protein [Aquimonas sp.]